MDSEIARHPKHGTYYIDGDTGVVYREGYKRAEGTDYTDDYFTKWDSFPMEGRERLAAIRYALIRDRTDAIELDRPSVLDYGCGTGDFIVYARKQPWAFQAMGYDLHQNKSNRALDNTFVTQEPLRTRKWDVLTMFDVMEHLEDPAEVLNAIPHRYLVVTVPNADPRLFANTAAFWKWRHLHPTEHIRHFNNASLPIYLRTLGYTCDYIGCPEDEVRVNEDQPFSNTITGVFLWNGCSSQGSPVPPASP